MKHSVNNFQTLIALKANERIKILNDLKQFLQSNEKTVIPKHPRAVA